MELRTAQEIRHNLRQLVEGEGWKYVKKMLEEQLRLKQQELGAQAAGMDGLIAKEFVAGERAGIMLALAMPLMQLSGVEEEVTALTEELEEERQDETVQE